MSLLIKASIRSFLGVALVVAGVAVSEGAIAQGLTHSYINTMRSSMVTHYYLDVNIDSEFGQLTREDDLSKSAATYWQGYGINNQLGVELGKFIQFYIGHVSLNLKEKAEAGARLIGSRFMAGARFVFYAPLGNLELGGGASSLQLDYISPKGNANFDGSGYFYELRYNYFLSPAVSFNVSARSLNEHLNHNGSNPAIKGFVSTTNVASLGWSLWY